MKKNIRKQKAKTPFFAQLLTRQEMQHTAAGTATSIAKDGAHTLKYPSDGDESTPTTDALA